MKQKIITLSLINQIFQLLSGLGIITAAILYIFNTIPNQEIEAQRAAWQVILSSQQYTGKDISSSPVLHSDFGRREALEALTENCVNKDKLTTPIEWILVKRKNCVLLNNINMNSVFLAYVNLNSATLNNTSFEDSNLHSASFKDAKLGKAILARANLSNANLRNTDLSEADLKKANLAKANLRGAYLYKTKNLTSKQLKTSCFWDEAIYTKANKIGKEKIWTPNNIEENKKELRKLG